jgi:hypothetical protein
MPIDIEFPGVVNNVISRGTALDNIFDNDNEGEVLTFNLRVAHRKPVYC